MDTILVAYYFSWLIAGKSVPELVGPYDEWGGCASAREWISHYFVNDDTSNCGLMPFPQPHSVFINVFDIAPQYGNRNQEVPHEPVGRLPGIGRSG